MSGYLHVSQIPDNTLLTNKMDKLPYQSQTPQDLIIVRYFSYQLASYYLGIR